MPEVRTLPLDDAAKLVDSSIDELLGEASAGRLQLSVTLESLLAWKETRNTMTTIPTASIASSVNKSSLKLDFGPFSQIDPFKHMWPDETVEPYGENGEAYQTTVQVNGRIRTIIVAMTERTSAGLTDRARATVFYQSPPKERALVEFSGNGTLATVTRYACPIKLRGAHTQLRPGDPIPDEYVEMPKEVFSKVVQGPYASNALAVVTDTADRDSMLTIMARHGVIRGVYKGWL